MEAIQLEYTTKNVTIHLWEPDILNAEWIHQKEIHRLLCTAWLAMNDHDGPMTPVLVGDPGAGKTVLAYCAAKVFDRPVYIMSCTSDKQPEDLIITPVISSDQKIMYQGSPLVSAVVNGGICILDEANRMSEKCWASLAPLLDDRQCLQSTVAGIKIPAHPEFRFVATMNEDSSTYTIPDYIESRLRPVLLVDLPSNKEIVDIVAKNAPYVKEVLIEAIVEYLSEKKKSGDLQKFSVRDAIKIARFAARTCGEPDFSIAKTVSYFLKVAGSDPHQTSVCAGSSGIK